MTNGGVIYGGRVDRDAREGDGARSHVAASPPVINYTDLLNMSISPAQVQAQTQAHSTAQQPGPSTTVSMADVQMFMNMAAAQASPADPPAHNNAIANNNGLPMGKCTTESEFFYFAD